MIVASLLLILVAVMLLVLGLTDGSSGLLIGSIVASLLAAVALVIGARKAAGARRAAAGRPAGPEPASDRAFAASDRAFAASDPAVVADESGFGADDPAFAAGDRGFAGGDRGFAGGDSGFAAAGPDEFLAQDDTAEFLAEPGFLAERAGEPSAGEPASTRPASTQPASTQPASSRPASSQPASSQPAASAQAAFEQSAFEQSAFEQSAFEQSGVGRTGRRGRRRESRFDDDLVPPGGSFAADSESSVPAAEQPGYAGGPAWDGSDPAVDLDLGDEDAWEQPFTTQTVDEHAARADEPAPDYDRASSAISGARSENPDEHAWRREPGPVPGDRSDPGDPALSDPALSDPALSDPAPSDPPLSVRGLSDPPLSVRGLSDPPLSVHGLSDPPLSDPGLSDPALGDPALGYPGRPGGVDRTGRDLHAEAAAHAGMSGLNDDFAEPDADDPDDEPLPQAVRPTDAVRVARMDAEVLVVDGRPRYHLADCTHLVGRLTEPIPVNEAVELGFSPCGLCRPVDRLVAAAARH